MDHCIYCKIIKGELPSYTIYEDDNFKAILDIFPSSLGHTLIIPKHHYQGLFDLGEKESKEIIDFSKKIAGLLKEVLGCDGMNILQNNGQAAGQTVFHYHMHLIPRYENDTINMGWKPLEPTQEELKLTLDKIKGAIK